jgi:PadR family transcriptional regulator, regulatory protein PadR
MAPQPRVTWAILKVFKVLLDDPTARHYGLEIGKAAGLPSGSIYPLLMRLEQAELLTSEWEDVDPKAAGRPRRRLYRLTGQGAEVGRRALKEAQRDLAPTRGRTPGFPFPREAPT